MSRGVLCFLGSLPVLSLIATANEIPAVPSEPIPAKIDYNRDIRPILSVNCIQCHGADAGARKAKLRLDLRSGAIAELDEGLHAIVPGNLEKSELYTRIRADVEERMPPLKSGHKLNERQIEILKRWIEQGAIYAEHWSFSRPQRAAIPPVKNGAWPKNAIDSFILARLESEGISPSAPADRYALVRRLSIDLTGLPPSPEEVTAFVADKGPSAYEKLVDRLLASPAFGERWARMWLDLARYADSAGYGSDPLRLNIWPYRDWVIDAFNKNMPYDQFTIEQIAGDLLPNATSSQFLASAFNRNTMTNTEGGTDREEFRVAAVKDRVNTTGQVWMGLTVSCAQCHSHKYDPISQKEYYQLFAVFNQSEDNDQPDERPTMAMPTASQLEQSDKLKAKIAGVEKDMESAPVDAEQAEWEKTFSRTIEWTPLETAEVHSSGGATLTKQNDGSILVSGKSPETDTYKIKASSGQKNITALRLEALSDDSLPGKGPGRSAGNGNIVLSELHVSVLPAKTNSVRGRFVRVTNTGKQKFLHLAEVQVFSGGQNVALKGKASQSSLDYGGEPQRAIDGNTNGDFTKNSVSHTKQEDNPWWEVDLGSAQDLERIAIWNRTDGGTHTRLENFKLDVLDDARKPAWEKMIAKSPNPSVTLPLDGGRLVALQNATADYSQADFGVENVLTGDSGKKNGWAFGGQTGKAHSAVFELASPLSLEEGSALQVTLVQNFGQQHTLGRFRLSATSAAQPVRILPSNIAAIMASPDKRSDQQKKDLSAYFRPMAPSLAGLRAQLAQLNKELADIKPVSVPIMRELPADKNRKSHILTKGNFLSPGDEVQAAAPAAFNPLPPGAPANRMGLALWLVDRANPLTARVAVNRFWAQIFGVGLVESEEDFGTQGTLPSHPELLDWLAVEFMEPSPDGLAKRAWDMKAMLKFVVMSATYQQSSRATRETIERDPRDRLLARFPRRRLEAEMVRDQALAISGLISRKIGGPSVYPMQPDGLWRAAFNGQRTYPTSTGDDRYRRGLYTFWRRTVPYPSMATFDAPSREVCTMKRISTNTPLQAFVTLNDPVYVECAQALARRIQKEGGATVEERIRYGLRLTLSREPQDVQVKALLDLYSAELEKYKADAGAAKKMATEPLGPLPDGMDPAQQAAMTVVANVLLNLDGLLMKG